MSNSEDNEYRTFSNARGILLLVGSLVGIFIPQSSVVLADDTEVDRTKSIIAMIHQPSSPDRNRVDEILAQIPLQSPLRPVASQAACIVHIQQGQFADALNCLQSNTGNTTSSTSVQLGAQRLKLWLLLEIESNEETDAIFRILVRVALSDRIEDNDKTSLIEWLGTLIGMLQTVDEPESISIDSLKKANNAIDARADDHDATRFVKQRAAAYFRGMALLTRIKEFQRLGVQKASQEVQSLIAELAKTKNEVNSLQEKIKEQVIHLQANESLHRNLIAIRRNLNVQLATVTPGKPDSPKKRKDGTEDQFEAREYDRAMERWEEKDRERRAWLTEQRQQIALEIAKKEKEIKEARNNIRDGSQEVSAQLKKLDEKASIARMALDDVINKKDKPNVSIRPSRFDLIDFTSEEARLLRALR